MLEGSSENLKPFKKGHKKMGGRKKGVPNKFSGDLKEAVLAAAAKVGFDGNGCGGLLGYFCHLGVYHPKIFLRLLIFVLKFELRSSKTAAPSILGMFAFNNLNDHELLVFQQIVEKACVASDSDAFLQLIEETRELRKKELVPLAFGSRPPSRR